MSTIRHFSAIRDVSKSSGAAAKMKKLEIQRGGKLPITSRERYKMMMNKKLEEHRGMAMSVRPGTLKDAWKMSKKAEEALKQMAMKKANKEEKALRQMVVIQPRVLASGRIDAKGRVYDIQNNLTLRINPKNGKISTLTGWSVGKYKPKSYFNGQLIDDAIKKHGPYFVRLRQLQMQQQMGQFNQLMTGAASQFDYSSINQFGGLPDIIDMHGNTHQQQTSPGAAGGTVTAWGVRSDNVWGTFSNNVWGTTGENVWGTTYTDIFGGFGTGGRSMWGHRGPNVWGTGNGKNYIKGVTSLFGAIFGFSPGRVLRRRALARATGGGRR